MLFDLAGVSDTQQLLAATAGQFRRSTRRYWWGSALFVRFLDGKALAAAAGAFCIGVFEHEPGSEVVLDPIHLAADQI